MKRILLSVFVIFFFSSAILVAQAANTSKLVWDQVSIDLTTANSYVYRYYPDGATTGILLAVTCIGTTSPFTCSVAYPAFTPGNYTLQLTAGNVAGESAKSAVFSFTFVVVPSAPVNIRIQ